MPNLSKEAIEILREVQRCILREPKLYNQIVCPIDTDLFDTPCCLSGWIQWVICSSKKEYCRKLEYCGVGSIMKALNISERSASLLFGRFGWPLKYIDAWQYPSTVKAAKAGVERINIFIESDGTI